MPDGHNSSRDAVLGTGGTKSKSKDAHKGSGSEFPPRSPGAKLWQRIMVFVTLLHNKR